MSDFFSHCSDSPAKLCERLFNIQVSGTGDKQLKTKSLDNDTCCLGVEKRQEHLIEKKTKLFFRVGITDRPQVVVNKVIFHNFQA